MAQQDDDGAGAAELGARFEREAVQRIGRFYADLARLGETPPARRFALEGFLEAGLWLGLVECGQVQRWLGEAQREHLGAELPVPPAAAGVALPVRWQRAPVYPG